jgi:ariadne-1
MDDSEEEMDYSDDDMSEMGGDGSEDDVGFADGPPVQRQESTFTPLDNEGLRVMAGNRVDEVMELLCCDRNVAAMLLRFFRWDQEKLMEEYLLNPESTLKKVGMASSGQEDRSVIHQGDQAPILVGGVEKPRSSMPAQKCMVCYDEATVYSALACGHAFCNQCYGTYLEHKIADEGHACIFARCPDEKCQLLVSDQLVRSLVPEGERLQQWENANLLERSFVDENPNIKWCPASDCGCAVKASKGQLGVACPRGHRFCYSCNLDDHRPSSCEDLKRWLVKCKDDSETYNWLVSNTKCCPKCNTSIEKNGGCNHITCKNGSCKHEWCWVCLGPWKDHAGSYYACNKYDPEKEKKDENELKKENSRAALERYLHYYTRYTNHDQSLKMEAEAKIKMEVKVKEMEKQGSNTWMDCQYLVEANEALHECRYALRYTYVYAFYLEKSGNHKANFEMQQSQLEMQTEELAGLLERDVKDIQRTEVVHCFQMCKNRLKNLFEIVDNRGSDGQGSSTDP